MSCGGDVRRCSPRSLSTVRISTPFTYLDFVMFSELKHPASKEELPDKHSLNRDAYYVGDLVYDNWRIFHKDDREVEDPRFVGSGGRRGVI